MKGINKRLIKATLKHYKKYKQREQEHDLDLKTKMPKCMANAFIYRLKFETIDLKTNLNILSEFEQIVLMKVLGNYLSFPKKKH